MCILNELEQNVLALSCRVMWELTPADTGGRWWDTSWTGRVHSGAYTNTYIHTSVRCQFRISNYLARLFWDYGRKLEHLEKPRATT